MSGATQMMLIMAGTFLMLAGIIWGPREQPSPPSVIYVERDPRTGIVTLSTSASFPFSTPIADPPTTSIDPGHK